IDAFYVLGQLWERPALAAAISSPGGAQFVATMVAAQRPVAATEAASAPKPQEPDAKDLLDRLNKLPVGWGARTFPALGDVSLVRFLGFYVSFLAGLAITASSAVFGAPFWFDLLQRLIQIRGTGAKPQSNREREEAEAAPMQPA